ncbi:MAG: mannonate dehydratase [Rhizobiaceae bacterium]
MEQTWRWFGPDDVVKISDICQTGATGVVTSLHHIPYGEVWTVDEIRKRQKQIADDSRGALSWSVVESLPVSDAIKLGEGDLEADFGNYRQSLRNLAACGITTICYNFMPVIDWTRTDLSVPLPGGARTLRFDVVKCAAFDCFILKRRGAEDDYGSGVVDDARRWIDASTLQQRSELFRSIMVGLPGAFKRYEIDEFSDILKVFSGLGRNGLLANLRRFLKEVVPTAEEVGARLAIHPDDPPRPLFGLTRAIVDAESLDHAVTSCPSPSNGITLCTGSLGAGRQNDLSAIARRFAGHIHFAHLRNVKKEPNGSFNEAPTLEGDVDMPDIVETLLGEQEVRQRAGRTDWRIPFRPDHGQELLDDIGKATHPGYPAIGRLKGLAELRGVISGISHARRRRES